MSGRLLGRYRLAAVAEEMPGAVLRAVDTLLDRPVALLLVPDATAAEPARLERIRRQVERAATFVHPNVATVYGLEEGDGRLFVTMEPVIGTSLESLRAAGQLPPAKALEAALVLCDVLAGAHEAGVEHGSLAAGDVVLGDDGSITVRGFGLGELRRAFAREPGGPAPASGPTPDHRADLLALARILEETVLVPSDETGAGESPAGAAASGMRQIVARCLSDDPAERPSSAGELRAPLESLQRELLREPEPLPGPPKGTVWSRLAAPRRAAVLAAGLVLAAILAWAVWHALAGPDECAGPEAVAVPAAAAAEPIDLAVLPFAGPDDPRQALLADGFGREVARLLAREGRLSVVAMESAAAAAAGETAPSEIAARLDVAHLLEGRFLWRRDGEIDRAEVTVRLSRATDGELLWSETLEAFFGEVVGLQGRVAMGVGRRLGAGAMAGARLPLTASSSAYEAYLEALGGSAAAADAGGLRQAASGFGQAVLLDSGLLLAHTRLVRLRLRLAADEPGGEGLDAARRALESARALAPGDPEVRRAAGELELAAGGPSEIARGELAAALEGLPGDPDLLRAIALIDRRLGRWDEALVGLTTARRRAPFDLDLGNDLVTTLAWKRRFGEAAAELGRLAALLPGSAAADLLRADLLLSERGAMAEARAVLEEMPETLHADSRWQERMLRLELYEGRHEAALRRLSALRLGPAEELIRRGWIHRYMGQASRAAGAFERARDQLDDRLEAAPGDPRLSALLGQAYAGTGGAHLGIRMGQRAVAQLPVTVDAVAGAELVERLARIYVLAGEHEQALDELAFLLEIPSPVTVSMLRLDPAWAPLREGPRFRSLIERFGP